MSSFIELIESLLSIIHLLQRIRNEQLLSAVIDKILKNTENEFIFGIRFVGFGKKIQNNGNLWSFSFYLNRSWYSDSFFFLRFVQNLHLKKKIYLSTKLY